MDLAVVGWVALVAFLAGGAAVAMSKALRDRLSRWRGSRWLGIGLAGASVVVAGLIGAIEAAYYLSHRYRPGPSLELLGLSAALFLLALSVLVRGSLSSDARMGPASTLSAPTPQAVRPEVVNSLVTAVLAKRAAATAAGAMPSARPRPWPSGLPRPATEALAVLAAQTARRLQVLPLLVSGETVIVATARPSNVFVKDSVAAEIGRRTSFVAVDESEIREAIDLSYPVRSDSA